jgi:hypothetical protein
MYDQGLARLSYRAEFEGSRVITNVLNARAVPMHVPQPVSV